MSAAAAAPTTDSKFQKTLTTFCAELRATFPELATATVRATTIVSPASYWRSWQGHLELLAARDGEALFSERRGILVPPLALTATFWEEISAETQTVIWRYLRTLLLEALMELSLDESTLTEERTRCLMAILTQERLEAVMTGSGEEAIAGMDASSASVMEEMAKDMFSGAGGLMERLQGLLRTAATMDASGATAADMPPFPEIPERLRNGCIMRLAQQMAQQFKPEEFGIDPAMLTSAGDNVEEVLRRLAELYQRDPTLLISGAKRMADRIRRQVMGGSLKQEELVAEARQFVELFKDHPLFKDAIGKFQELVGEGGMASMFGGGGGSAAAPSERLRTVQERLRKRLAARQAKK